MSPRGTLGPAFSADRRQDFALEAGLAAARDLFERVGLERVYAGVDPENEKSLRALAKAPGVRRLDDELYELTAQALR